MIGVCGGGRGVSGWVPTLLQCVLNGGVASCVVCL